MPGCARRILFPLLALALAGSLGGSGPAPLAAEPQPLEECTIGVACAWATAGGRPLLWKTRDTDSRDNEVYFNDAFPHRFLAVVNADGGPESLAWMGVNERGFAILNANVSGLREEPDYPGNGRFMRDALGTCASAAEFVAMLDSTAAERATHGCFGVIDTTGAALMFEVSADAHWTYDAAAAPGGWLVRTNFACKDTLEAGPPVGSGGIERFLRSNAIVAGLVADGELSAAGLLERQLRDFANRDGNPIAVPCPFCGGDGVPPGHIDTSTSICGEGAASAAIVEGVAPGADPEEPAWLSTMWVLLGNPALSVALPFWPVGPAPAAADGAGTAPLCNRARVLHRVLFEPPAGSNLADSYFLSDGAGGGLWAETLPLEQAILTGVDGLLDGWRSAPPLPAAMLAVQDSLADRALGALLAVTAVAADGDADGSDHALLVGIEPNPFVASARIAYRLPGPGPVRLTVHDVRGRLVAELVHGRGSVGLNTATWRAGDAPSGVYLLRLRANGVTDTRKVFRLR